MKEKMDKLESDQRGLNETRQNFSAVAKTVSSIFFLVLELQQLEAMYCFSLEWYLQLFEASTHVASGTHHNERVNSIIDSFLRILYQKVCLSLLERGKKNCIYMRLFKSKNIFRSRFNYT